MAGGRYVLNLSEQAASALAELQQAQGVEPAEVVHEALNVLWWLREQRLAGHRILVERGEVVTELVSEGEAFWRSLTA